MASVFQRTQVHQAKEILTGLGAAKSSGRIGFCPANIARIADCKSLTPNVMILSFAICQL